MCVKFCYNLHTNSWVMAKKHVLWVTVILTFDHFLISSSSSPFPQGIPDMWNRHKNVYCFKHHEKNNYSRVIGCHGPTASHNQPVLKLVHSPTGAAAAAAAGGGAAPDLFQGPDTLSPLTRIISPSSPTSSFSYSSSSFSSLKTNKQTKKNSQ